MIRLIIGVVAFIALFAALGLDEKEVEKTNWDGRKYTDHVKCWRLQKKQWLALIPLLIFGASACICNVPANHVGIIYSPFGGTKEQTLDEGIAFKSPLDKIYVISTEEQTTTIEDLTTQTMDAQYVTSTLDVKYKVNEANAFMVFKQYRTLENMDAKLIKATTQRVLEKITTKQDVFSILGEGRNDVYTELDIRLKEEFAKYGVEYRSITISDMDAGKKIEEAISKEATAKKEVETAEQNLKKAEIEAKKEVAKAKADQEAAKIKAETKIINAEATKKSNELLEKSLTDKILQQQWIAKWNGKLPTYYGSEGNLMIGVGNAAK